MDFRKTCVLVTTSFFLLFASFVNLASEQDNTLVKAIKLFDQQEYEAAEVLLKELLDKNPDHLMVNYFYGACRTENEKYGNKEIGYLLKGSTGEAPLKTNYYLGIQYQAQNRWEEAISHYKTYQSQIGEEEQNELKLAEKIQQCQERINPYRANEAQNAVIAPIPRPEEEQAKIAESATVASGAVYPGLESDTITADTTTVAIDSAATDTLQQSVATEEPAPQQPKAERIDFTINGTMTYIDTSNFQTKEGLHNFMKWHTTTSKLDSLKALMAKWRNAYARATTSAERDQFGNKIIAGENELFALQNATKDYNTLAIKAEDDFWKLQPEEDRLAFAKFLTELDKSYTNPQGTVEPAIDTTIIIPQEIGPNVVTASATNTDKNETGLVYRIQIGAYSRGLPNYVKKLFDKLSYIRKIENYTDDRGVVVYTTGNLTNYEDAIKMQNQVRQEGIEDAFVVPYINGKRITLEEAKKLEQEK